MIASRPSQLPDRQRIVITGIGLTSPNGNSLAEMRENLLAGNRRPTAIFCGNDEMAAGVYKVALRAGIAIPQQLSVIGFDDSPLASRLWPALSSVRLPIRDMGRIAASMLLQPDAASASALAANSVHPHLVIRDSCHPPQQ